MITNSKYLTAAQQTQNQPGEEAINDPKGAHFWDKIRMRSQAERLCNILAEHPNGPVVLAEWNKNITRVEMVSGTEFHSNKSLWTVRGEVARWGMILYLRIGQLIHDYADSGDVLDSSNASNMHLSICERRAWARANLNLDGTAKPGMKKLEWLQGCVPPRSKREAHLESQSESGK